MTLRTNTIEYAFTTNTATVANNTRYDFSEVTIYIPNTTSRTFRSAIAIVSCTDVITATGGTINNWLVGCKLGAVAFSDITEASLITHTGENMAPLFAVDFTSYWNTNFGSGASQTCQIGVLFNQSTGTTLGMNNISVKLIITYQFDDAGATTGIKTVRIPIESIIGASPTTLTAIGTNQIPALDTFLPETSKTYRDIFFEMTFNEQNAASAGTYTLGLALDAESEAASGAMPTALVSSRNIRYVWKRTNMATNAAHAFMQRMSLSGRGHMFSAVLIVTYEYAISSTTLMNSLHIPFNFEEDRNATASADYRRVQVKVMVEEPATVTLVQSGLQLFWTQPDVLAGFAVRAGSQVERAYTTGIAGCSYCGGQSLIQRIDAGGAQGAGVTLARGENTITIDVYTTDTTDPCRGLCGILILNYTSGKAAGGPFAHNHSTAWYQVRLGARVPDFVSTISLSSFAFNIPETSYWMNHVGITAPCLNYNNTGWSVDYLAELGAGEGYGGGWRRLGGNKPYGDVGEVGMIPLAIDASRHFMRHPSDPDTYRMNPETARSWLYSFDGTPYWQAQAWLTYHAITFTVSGSSSGHTGSGNPVNIYRADTCERLYSTTTDGSGNYTVTGYDSAIDHFAECRISDTLNDRTGNWKFS